MSLKSQTTAKNPEATRHHGPQDRPQ